MDKSLSPRDAAERLGITTDTLRRWERDGLIEPERTPGGQRRYREEDISALLNDERPRGNASIRPISVPFPAMQHRQDSPPLSTTEPAIPPWDRRVKEEAAEVEVTKLRREKAALLRAEREEQEEREKSAAWRKQEFASRQAEAERLKQAEAAESQRFANLRAYGNALATSAPAEFQAKVARDLLKTVTSAEYPPDLSLYLAYSQVSARVSELLKPWKESQEREREREQDARNLRNLVYSALSYARTQTADWDREECARALREVEEALELEADSDWSMDELRDLVDEVLDEYDDD
jgi:excisionase family DNA binding protein